ncbi:atp-binding cassette sub-family e member [Anaeramoeba flamelloides]|uniref:Atp-binding cassette sub-family e member n=1 Tax=Anaeramoeba flamelloides TaxID=1746091 RepID=A0AAV7YEI6_9EUKA|nr:atp-binding cassette sub-family e member [Anaeramoeba flamelloides]
MGKKCIVKNEETGSIEIDLDVCVGCMICVKRCKPKALSFLNVESIFTKKIFEYATDNYWLSSIPFPQPGKILGIMGGDFLGKSTILKLLSGKLIPTKDQKNWEKYLISNRKTGIVEYLNKIYNDEMKIRFKVQRLENYIRNFKGKIHKQFEKSGVINMKEEILTKLSITNLGSRDFTQTSANELQRIAIGLTVINECNIYIIDQPTDFLDIEARYRIAKIIRSLSKGDNYIIVVDHDLSFLDYVSDICSFVYGVPSKHGYSSQVQPVREGINDYLQGYDNHLQYQFRSTALKFLDPNLNKNCEKINEIENEKVKVKVKENETENENENKNKKENQKEKVNENENEKEKENENENEKVNEKENVKENKKEKEKEKEREREKDKEEETKIGNQTEKENENQKEKHKKTNKFNENNSNNSKIFDISYQNMQKRYQNYQLTVKEGIITKKDRIIVLLGKNGSGKTTFMKMLAGVISPEEEVEISKFKCSYKSQKVIPRYKGTVKELFEQKISNSFQDQDFNDLVIKPLQISKFYTFKVRELGGKEITLVALCLALGKTVDLYILDEPFQYLDSEQQIKCANVIRNFMTKYEKRCLISLHNLMITHFLANSIIVFEQIEPQLFIANSIESVYNGLNRFLNLLQITACIDKNTHRLRLNKNTSQKDVQQKKNNVYFFVPKRDFSTRKN